MHYLPLIFTILDPFKCLEPVLSPCYCIGLSNTYSPSCLVFTCQASFLIISHIPPSKSVFSRSDLCPWKHVWAIQDCTLMHAFMHSFTVHMHTQTHTRAHTHTMLYYTVNQLNLVNINVCTIINKGAGWKHSITERHMSGSGAQNLWSWSLLTFGNA